MPEAERPSAAAEPPIATNAAPALDPFDLSPDPIVLFGPDGTRLRANAAFAKTFPHALSGARPPWGRTTPPPFSDGERCFEAAAPDGRRYEWRERLLPNGARIAVARDVSARAEAAEQAARAKTVLFATLTHELRTPLNGVLGMAGVLSQTVRSPAEAEYLRAIQRSGEHLLTLITEILDYARLESETVEIEESAFDPEDMAQSIAELLSPPAHAKGVELFVRARADAPRKVLATSAGCARFCSTS
jgi:signal transduction histidine kinase